MVKAVGGNGTLDTAELRVCVETHWQVTALRYFRTDGEFARQIAGVLGQALPLPITFRAASTFAGSPYLLAWRTPTESLLLCEDRPLCKELDAIDADGCCVDLSSSRRVVRVEGCHGAALMGRLGSSALDPPIGGARSGRLADVSALVLRLQSDTWLLIVDRVYLEHLLHWIELTAGDLRTVITS